MKLRVLLLLLFNLFFVIACQKQQYAAPACRAAVSSLTYQQEAACITRIGKQLLVIKRPSGLYDLPYSEKISMSAEKPDLNISSQCKAHQAMWEQTGLNVEVGKKLSTQKNGTILFACSLPNDAAGFDGSETDIPAPPWQPKEVESLEFIYPFDIELNQWQKPDHFTSMRDAYVASGRQN
uniref:hypothetical protein n=1 Tax=Ningiella ruwaisensis TaxID=2364274 RepID=UPI00109F7E54|nr:hypothetical protein [Ningiella ruwaisensis]